jgi:hypothetical protein
VVGDARLAEIGTILAAGVDGLDVAEASRLAQDAAAVDGVWLLRPDRPTRRPPAGRCGGLPPML